MPTRLATADDGCKLFVGVGGIGTGLFFALDGDDTLGRNESRPGRLLDVRDYCKLHIIAHYVARLMGARSDGEPFHVMPVGFVGDDDRGARLIHEMKVAGMDTTLLKTSEEKPTLFSVCFQYPDGSGGNITTSDAAASTLGPADVEAARSALEAHCHRAAVLAAPEAPLDARAALLKLATETDCLRVASLTSAEIGPAREAGLFEMIDLLAINEDEAAAIAGEPFDLNDPQPFLARLAETLRDLQPHINIVISAGKAGAWAFDAGCWEHCPAPSVVVASTAGAGDALLAGVLSGVIAGLPLVAERPERRELSDGAIETALDLGVLLAAYSVTSPHTIHPKTDMDHLSIFAGELGVRFSEALRERIVADQ